VLILFLLVRATWVFFITHIPFVVNRTFNTMLTQRLQHLMKCWARLFEMTQRERGRQNATWENLDINNLQSNLLKQHLDHFLTYRLPFHSMLGTIFKLIGRYFMAGWAPFQSKKMSQKKREISCGSTLIRACKPMTRSDTTVLVTRLWLDSTKSWLWLD